MAASADDVYQTMQGSFPAPAYNLSLRDIQGDVLDGGVMIFDVPRMTGLQYTNFEYEMSWASLKQILVSLHPVGEDSCEVVIRSSVRPYRRIGAGMGVALAGVTGFGGGLFGVGLGFALGTGLGLGTGGLVPLVGGLAALTGGTVGRVSRIPFRKLMAYGLRRGEKALEGLLSALNVSVIAGWGGGGRAASTDESGAIGLLADRTK